MGHACKLQCDTSFAERGRCEQSPSVSYCPYTITGCVTHGFAEGRKMGFPTANLDTSGYPLLIPANGVYGVWVKIGCADAVMGKCEATALAGFLHFRNADPNNR